MIDPAGDPCRQCDRAVYELGAIDPAKRDCTQCTRTVLLMPQNREAWEIMVSIPGLFAAGQANYGAVTAELNERDIPPGRRAALFDKIKVGIDEILKHLMREAERR